MTTAGITAITVNSATAGGVITFAGDPAYTERGVCYSINPGPNVKNNFRKVAEGSGIGAFTATIEGLEAATKYYVLAYATSSAGTFYGNEVSFTTGHEAPVSTVVSCD